MASGVGVGVVLQDKREISVIGPPGGGGAGSHGPKGDKGDTRGQGPKCDKGDFFFFIFFFFFLIVSLYCAVLSKGRC